MIISSAQLDTKHLVNGCHCLIIGKEIFLKEKSLLLIEEHLATLSITPQVFHIDNTGFDWAEIWSITQNAGLFEDENTIILRSEKNLKKAQHDELNQLFQILPHTRVIIILPDSNKTQEKQTWYQTIQQSGLIIKADPIPSYKFVDWVKYQFQKNNYQLNSDGLTFVTTCYQSNLFGLEQLLHNLKMLQPDGIVETALLKSICTDQSNYTVFQCVDYALVGDIEKSQKILNQLENQNQQPAIILWQAIKEVRSIVNMKYAIEKGADLQTALRQENIWQSKKAAFVYQLKKRSLKSSYQLLQQAKQVDMTIKGIAAQRAWAQLSRMLFSIATP